MEIEFQEDKRRGKFIVFFGVILAVVAGVGAYVVISGASRQAGAAGLPMTQVVVAARAIPAREPIVAEALVLREVPMDPANTVGVATKAEEVVGRIPAVSISQGQIVTTNMLASTTEGGEFSILQPDETIAPDSEAWRAVSITVPDDLAVGGMLTPGQTVDVLVTTVVNVPQDLASTGRYISERSTKVTYQDVLILARKEAFYVIRVALPIAEEISHLQASGAGTFSLALRPQEDTRTVDTRDLGETTNRIITRYGLPIPEPVAPSRGSATSDRGPAAPTPAAVSPATPTPAPSPVP